MIDLAEELAEFLLEEFDNIEAEVHSGRVCLYMHTSDTLTDGSCLSAYAGSVQIMEDRVVLALGGDSPLSNHTLHMKSYNLNDPKSFEKLFEKIKEIMGAYAKVKVIDRLENKHRIDTQMIGVKNERNTQDDA